MDSVINATNWTDLKKQLKPLEGKAIFTLQRVHSFQDGTFHRVLHEVHPHELVFFDGEQSVYLEVPKSKEDELEFFENGFRYKNCTYTLEKIMEE